MGLAMEAVKGLMVNRCIAIQIVVHPKKRHKKTR